MQEEEQVIRITQNWIERLIIAHQICPFASKVHQLGQIHYRVMAEQGLEKKLLAVQQSLQLLKEQAKWDTAFLIFPQSFIHDFLAYLDFVAMSEALLHDLGYEGVYQIATFHPQYQFAGTSLDDPANYTNRSPFSMLHFLREASVEQALKHYENPEAIPERNIAFARKEGLDRMKERLKSCHKLSED